MALTTFFMTVSLAAMASAGFPGWPDNDNPFPGFHQPMISSLRYGPISSPPSLHGFFQNFPLFQFPAFPSMPPFPSMPSVSDIANAVPSKGGTFSGVVLSSKTETKKKEDGTVVKEGGSTILINQDGVVKVEKTGNAPPDLPIKPKTSSSFDFDAPQIKPDFKPYKFKNFNNNDNRKDFEDFNSFGQFRKKPIFQPFPMFVSPMSPEELKSYAPDEGTTFEGHSISSHSFSSNVNGDITLGGGVASIDNVNGRVDEKNIAYHKHGAK